MIAIGLAILFVLFLAVSSIRIISEYDRAVVFRLGRSLPEARGPGLILLTIY